MKAIDNLKLYYAGCHDEFSKAVCYETGQHVKQDLNKALELYRSAMEQGDARAYFRIAQWYEKKSELSEAFDKYFQGALKDNEPSRLALEQWSEKNVPENNIAAFLMGKLWVEKQDWEKAITWYEKAAQNGNLEAMFQTGQYYLQQNRVEEAKRWLTQAANNNHPDALFHLGQYYLTEQNETIESIKLFKRAAVQGFQQALDRIVALSDTNGNACFLLAEMYERGEGDLNFSLQKSQQLYLQASKLGSSEANFRLGQLYENGEQGLEHNRSKSYSYYGLAACQGNVDAKKHLLQLAAAEDAEAQYTLGYHYYHKQHDLTEAIKWCVNADINGHRLAFDYLQQQAVDEKICLQIISYYKEDVFSLFSDKNKRAQRIIDFYIQAATLGSSEASFELAQLYENGFESLKLNREKACYYYAQAACLEHAKAKNYLLQLASTGNAEAQYALGYHYYHAKNDLHEAIHWCTKAEIQQHPKAAVYLMQVSLDAETYFQIGNYYENDKINPGRSIQRAIDFYTLSIHQGSLPATLRLAHLYETGFGELKPDQANSYSCYAFAALQGDEEAINHLTKLANAENAEAQYALGYHYYHQIGNVNEAIRWCVKADIQQHPQAAQYVDQAINDPESYFEIAIHYYETDTINPARSLQCAIKLYNKASQQGLSEASYRLGQLYENGYDLERDQEKSFYYYALAASQGNEDVKTYLIQTASAGNPEAQYALGYHYYREKNDLTEALNWCIKAEIQQHPKAADYLTKTSFDAETNLYIANYYENDTTNLDRSIQPVLEFYTKAANLGSLTAILRLAQLYENGLRDLKPDQQKSYYYYALAACQGDNKARIHLIELATAENAAAQYALGYHYYQQIDNISEAILWCVKADIQQHPHAADYLAQAITDAETYFKMANYYYEEDKIYPARSIQRAIELYTTASQLGLSKASFRLGQLYENGTKELAADPLQAALYFALADKQKHPEAKKSLKRLAINGNPEAQYQLGNRYSHTTNKFNKAINWFFKADINQHPQASKQLATQKLDAATCLKFAQQYEIDKTYPEANILKAITFYERAIKQNSKEAAFKLSQFYQLNHPSIKTNPELAFDYCLEAAKLGHQEVFIMLDRLGEEMDPERQQQLSVAYSTLNHPEKAAYWQSKADEIKNSQLNP